MLRALATWSGAIAGLLLILTGGLIQAAVPTMGPGGVSVIPLPMTLQVPALLLTALVFFLRFVRAGGRHRLAGWAVCVLLAAAASSPETRLLDLPCMDATERRLVVEEWNATAVDYPGNHGIAQAFVDYGNQSGPVAVGEKGGGAITWLPEGWRVAAIDVQQGQLLLQAEDGRRVPYQL
jgi:hypothetical protein